MSDLPSELSREPEGRAGGALSLDREMAALSLATNGLLNGSVAFLVAKAQEGGPASILYANDAFLRLTGYPLGDVLGQPYGFLRGPDTPSDLCATLDHAFATGSFCDIDVLHYKRDGTPFWNGVTVSPLRDTSGEPGTFLLFMRDVTARRRADDRMAALADRLRDLAMSDPLTGIANRRSFDAMLAREWRRAERLGGYTTLAMIDIDHFKAFNDRFGHPAGDACLRSVVGALGSVIRRPTDFIARYGGEEFAILMPDITPEDAAMMAGRMIAAVRDAGIDHPCQPSGHISISCGLISAMPARYPGGPDRFVAEADRALYDAKAAGRDRMHQVIVAV